MSDTPEAPTLGYVTPAATALDEVRRLVQDYAQPAIVTINDPLTNLPAVVSVSQDGVSAVPRSVFNEYRTNPRWRSGTATLLDLESLIEIGNRFGGEDSLVFADNDRKKPSATIVFDYHAAGVESDAARLEHRAHFAFPLSDEWKAWQEADGKVMGMTAFAAFLEDRIVDVMPVASLGLSEEQQRFVTTLGGKQRIAEPAKLMEISTGLQVFEQSEVSQAVKLQTGEAKMTFNAKHVDGQGGELVVPSMFVIAIPVFVNGPLYQVIVRFRYRKTGEGLKFFVELWRTDKVFDHAFKEGVATLSEQTGITVVLGKPEHDGVPERRDSHDHPF